MAPVERSGEISQASLIPIWRQRRLFRINLA
jgi:hypothetical protein